MSEPSASRELAADYSARADAYARFWAPVIAPMARPLFAELPLADARRILDLGCGSGDLLGDAKSAAPEATVFGVDPAAGMLRRAREATDAPLAVMDAQRLAFPDRVFDGIVLSFVLFHIQDPIDALREVGRVLRPTGVAGAVVWGKDDDNAWDVVWREELDSHGAAPDSRDPDCMQHARMDDGDKLRALIESGGLTITKLWTRRFEHRWSPEAVFQMQTSLGSHRRRLESLPEERRTRCRTRVLKRLQSLSAEDLTYRPPVLYAIAGSGGMR